VGKWTVKSDKVKEKTFTLSDTKEGSSYEFRVSAVNKAGQGPASASSPSAKYGQQSFSLIYDISIFFFTFLSSSSSSYALINQLTDRND